MFENIISGFNEFFNFSSFLYMNIGLFLGVIFGAIPGLSVMLCLVLFLPFTYSIGPIESLCFYLEYIVLEAMEDLSPPFLLELLEHLTLQLQ